MDGTIVLVHLTPSAGYKWYQCRAVAVHKHMYHAMTCWAELSAQLHLSVTKQACTTQSGRIPCVKFHAVQHLDVQEQHRLWRLLLCIKLAVPTASEILLTRLSVGPCVCTRKRLVVRP